MHPTTVPLMLLAVTQGVLAQNRSAKRGIVYVDSKVASDNDHWTDKSADLTWYYNYQDVPTPALANTDLEFVPMQWGLQDNYWENMTFYDAVEALQQTRNISHVLGFNEPDACYNGSACVKPNEAAVSWIHQFEPMRTKLNISLGGPAVTNAPSGWTWLQQFHGACARLKQNLSTGCEYDFLPMHYYGNISGFTEHVNEVMTTYDNVSSFWITEFNADKEDLIDSEVFYNESTKFLDGNDKIGRYSMFAAFRSTTSNVGPNGAFLDKNGNLTDIGSWYLGGVATGNVPSAAAHLAIGPLISWVAIFAGLVALLVS